MKISIFGSGYVGLVTAACLAEVGHEVKCFDILEDRISSLKKKNSADKKFKSKFKTKDNSSKKGIRKSRSSKKTNFKNKASNKPKTSNRFKNKFSRAK